MSAIITDPQHWIERAKDARELAEQIADPVSKRAMLAIAEGYLVLSARAEKRARLRE